MFCPNCGKQIKDCDNFCRYCGYDLRDDFATVVPAEGAEKQHEILEEYVLPSDNEEELVLYDVRKHWMAFFWPVIITPVFFVYFWTIFLNTHSLLSWFVVFLLLGSSDMVSFGDNDLGSRRIAQGLLQMISNI